MPDNIKEKIEDKIIDLINSSAGGRLVIFKPENSDKDLVVEKRGDYKKKPVSFKIYGQDASSKDQNFIKEIQNKNLDAEDGFYLIFAYFDIVEQDIEDPVWLIPSFEFAAAAGDNLSKFLIKKKDIGKFLIKKFGK